EGGAAQLDQLLFDRRRELALGVEQRGDHALVAELRQRRVAGQLARHVQRDRLELLRRRDAVDKAPLKRRVGVDVAAEQEQLTGARGADRVQEAAQARVRVD